MGLLGIVSLFQIALLPGLLLQFAFRQTLDRTDRAISVLPLSFATNYCIVVALSLLGCYTQKIVLWGVLLPELLLLAAFLVRRGNQTWQTLRVSFSVDLTLLVFIAVVLSYLIGATEQLGTVFTANDAVASWDRWAEDWFAGRQPVATNYYPQLLPTLYSLNYQFMGTAEVKLFAKLIPAIFVLSSLTVCWRAAQLMPGHRGEILWGFALFAALFHRLNGDMSQFTGYADFPLVYFTAVAGWSLLLLNREPKETQHRWIFVLTSFLIAAAAVVKQSGMWLVLVFPPVWYFFIARKQFSRAFIFSTFMRGGLVLLLVAFSWYIYKYAQIKWGGDNSNLQQLADLVPKSKGARIPYAMGMLVQHFTLPLTLSFFGLFLLGMRDHLIRYIQIWVGLPMFFFWAYFVPYDFRNLSLALLPVSLGIAAGGKQLLLWTHNHRAVRLASIVLLLSLLSALAMRLASPSLAHKLVEKAAMESRKIGENPLFNQKLYVYFELHPEAGRVLTVDVTAGKLPELSRRMWVQGCDSIVSDLQQTTDVKWVVTAHYCPDSTMRYLQQQVADGKMRLVFHQEASDWRFYERLESHP